MDIRLTKQRERTGLVVLLLFVAVTPEFFYWEFFLDSILLGEWRDQVLQGHSTDCFVRRKLLQKRSEIVTSFQILFFGTKVHVSGCKRSPPPSEPVPLFYSLEEFFLLLKLGGDRPSSPRPRNGASLRLPSLTARGGFAQALYSAVRTLLLSFLPTDDANSGRRPLFSILLSPADFSRCRISISLARSLNSFFPCVIVLSMRTPPLPPPHCE